MLRSVCCFLLCGSVALLAGCGGETPKDVPKGLINVTGKVTYKGNPVPNATVSFVPTLPDKQSSVGKTDSSGNYTLEMSPSAKGVLPGEYRVRIEAVDGVAGMGAKGEVIKPKSLIPEKYAKVDTSGIMLKVSPSEKKHDFELKD